MNTNAPDRGPVREVLATAEGLRVQLVTLDKGQLVPWHRHTVVADTILAVVGSVVVELRASIALHQLEPGDRLTIPAGTVHMVHGRDGVPCRFLNLHSGGIYDFQLIEAS